MESAEEREKGRECNLGYTQPSHPTKSRRLPRIRRPFEWQFERLPFWISLLYEPDSILALLQRTC